MVEGPVVGERPLSRGVKTVGCGRCRNAGRQKDLAASRKLGLLGNPTIFPVATGRPVPSGRLRHRRARPFAADLPRQINFASEVTSHR